MTSSAITTNQSAGELSRPSCVSSYSASLRCHSMLCEYPIEPQEPHAHHASVLMLTLWPLLTQSARLAVRPATRRANASDSRFRHRLASDRSVV
jgi:hypothetical protein